MTRKDYQIIAEIVALIKTAEEIGTGVEDCRKGILELLKPTNPNFKPDRFWNAVEKKVLENRAITK